MIRYMGEGGFILGQTCMEEYLPWLRPEATKYIESKLHENAKVFEWGMGASTIWLAKKKCKVISLELNRDWYYQISKKLIEEELLPFVQPYYFGKIDEWDEELYPDSMQMYADAILCWDIPDLDFVLIDGRNRCRCLANARSKVKVGGILCLDNSERHEYAKAVALLNNWDGYEWGDSGWSTTVWTRPEGEIQPVEFPNEDA